MNHLNVSVVLSAGTCFGSDIGGKSKAMCATEGGKKKPAHTQNVSPARQGGFQLQLRCSRVGAEVSAELSTQILCS